jgi:hypothetical protein
VLLFKVPQLTHKNEAVDSSLQLTPHIPRVFAVVHRLLKADVTAADEFALATREPASPKADHQHKQ